MWLFWDMLHSIKSRSSSYILFSHYWQNVFAAGWNGLAGRSLETPDPDTDLPLQNKSFDAKAFTFYAPKN